MRFGVYDVEVKMPFPQRPRTLDEIPMFQVRYSLTLLESGELKAMLIIIHDRTLQLLRK